MKMTISGVFAALAGIVFIISACFLDAEGTAVPMILCALSGLGIVIYGYTNGWCESEDIEADTETEACGANKPLYTRDADIIVFHKSNNGKKLLDA